MKSLLLKLINKVYNWVDFIKKDNVLHAYVSTIISNIIFIICINNDIYPWLSLIISGVVTIMIGFFKEYIIDLFLRKTIVEKKDLVSDIVGTILGLIINILMISVCH